jgi:hypothetical protein
MLNKAIKLTGILAVAAVLPVVAEEMPVRLMTLDPGHFHPALVQKSMYPEVDAVVHVYAPEGLNVLSDKLWL